MKNKIILILFLIGVIIISVIIFGFLNKKQIIAPTIEQTNNQTNQPNQPSFKGPVGEPHIIGPTSPLPNSNY